MSVGGIQTTHRAVIFLLPAYHQASYFDLTCHNLYQRKLLQWTIAKVSLPSGIWLTLANGEDWMNIREQEESETCIHTLSPSLCPSFRRQLHGAISSHNSYQMAPSFSSYTVTAGFQK